MSTVAPAIELRGMYPPIPSKYPAIDVVTDAELGDVSHTKFVEGKASDVIEKLWLDKNSVSHIIERRLPRHFTIGITFDPDSKTGKLFFNFEERTPTDGVLSTRLFLTFFKANNCFLDMPGHGVVEFKLNPLSEANLQSLLYKARLYRKLLYIEKTLGAQIILPKEISTEDAARIDTIFRGITRCNVHTETDSVTLYKSIPTDKNFDNFSSYRPKALSFDLHDMELFGKNLPVGNVIGIMPHALLVSKQIEESAQNEQPKSVAIRFVTLDKKLVFHFKDYAAPYRERQALLEKFRDELLTEELPELANLVLEPLKGYVSSGEAIEIAFDTIYSKYQDKLRADSVSLTPHPPELESDKQRWVVSVQLKDVDQNPFAFFRIYVDSKTGKTLSLPVAEHALNYIVSTLASSPHYDKVLKYLLEHPDMVDPVTSICAETHRQFGANSEISLELYNDPEFDDAHLKLYIRQAIYDKNIMTEIENIRVKHSGMLADLSGWLHITTDFRPLRLKNAV